MKISHKGSISKQRGHKKQTVYVVRRTCKRQPTLNYGLNQWPLQKRRRRLYGASLEFDELTFILKGRKCYKQASKQWFCFTKGQHSILTGIIFLDLSAKTLMTSPDETLHYSNIILLWKHKSRKKEITCHECFWAHYVKGKREGKWQKLIYTNKDGFSHAITK